MAAAPVPTASAPGKEVVEWDKCGQNWNCKEDKEAAHGLTGNSYLPLKVVFDIFTLGKEATRVPIILVRP
jgi:hypothetical protein